MADKKDFSVVSYTLGILSIVLVFFTPIAGLILGIVGLVHSKKQKTPLSLKAKKLNTIGIVLGAIFTIISLALTIYLTLQGGNALSFPTF